MGSCELIPVFLVLRSCRDAAMTSSAAAPDLSRLSSMLAPATASAAAVDKSAADKTVEELKAAKVQEKKEHLRFFASFLKVLPHQYQSMDQNRMTVAYFCLSALDLLGALDTSHDAKARSAAVEWIYNQQVQPGPDGNGEYESTPALFIYAITVARCGFRGYTGVGVPRAPSTEEKADLWSAYPHDEANLAHTYSALAALKVLGDDWSKVNKKAIIGSLKYMQEKDGSFRPTYKAGESDMRFVFTACVISALLNDWSGFDLDLTTKYIVDSQRYDGAFAMGPGLEGHGGSTYVAVASLALMNRLDRIRDLSGLLRWCVTNQGHGWCGRPNKDPDTCYSFWVGATLELIGGYGFSSPEGNREFNLHCQFKLGGFSKYPDMHPDVLHAYYGLCGLSLCGLDNLRPLNVVVGMSTRAAASISATKAS